MDNVLKIEYDMKDMADGIKEAVKRELGKDFASQIISEFKSELKEKLIDDAKDIIGKSTYDFVQQIMKDIYDNEKVVIGGGWNEPTTEYSLREYVIEQTKKRIINNDCEKTRGGYGSTSFNEWFTNKCVDSEIERIIEKQIKDIRHDVNYKVKNMFDQNTKQMLSDTVLNILMANDTYKRIEGSIASIADK